MSFFVLTSAVDSVLPQHILAVVVLAIVGGIFFYKFFQEFIMKA